MAYFMKLTAAGAAKVAAAMSGGPAVNLTDIAVGDGDGVAVGEPVGTETALVNEVYEAAITDLQLDPGDDTIFVAEMTIASAVGGWTVREIGIKDEDGDLFAYGNFPATPKPIAAEGATREMMIRCSVRVASASAVTLVVDPSTVLASREWAEDTFIQRAGDTMTGPLTLVGDPVDPLDAVTKQYADALAAGLAPKKSVLVATTGNIALVDPQTIDGVVLVPGDRVIVKNQSDLAENGLYVVAAGAWARSADANSWDRLVSAYAWVDRGTANKDTAWVCIVDAGGTLNTTDVTFEKFAGGFIPATGGTMTGHLAVPAGAAGAQAPQTQEVVKKSGDTMTGHLSLPGGAAGAQAPQIQEVVKKSGDTMTGPLILSADPSAALGAAPKQFVEAAVAAGGLPTLGTVTAGSNVSSLSLTIAAWMATYKRIYIDFSGVILGTGSGNMNSMIYFLIDSVTTGYGQRFSDSGIAGTFNDYSNNGTKLSLSSVNPPSINNGSSYNLKGTIEVVQTANGIMFFTTASFTSTTGTNAPELWSDSVGILNGGITATTFALTTHPAMAVATTGFEIKIYGKK